MNVLNIAAHPDDELLGQGGTIALHARAGDRVTTVIVCEGSSVRYGAETIREIEAESRSANEILGVRDVRFLRLPDQELDRIPLIEVIRPLEALVKETRPHTLYTHSATDLNRDHRTLLEAVLVATRPYAAPWIREIHLFDTISSTEWGGPPMLPAFHPQGFVDIRETLELKERALECYRREIRPWPHPRSVRGIRARAEYWGSQVGYEAAEAFQILRLLR